MIHIILENFLWKVKNMTKQTKIIISVVLSCTILLLLFVPSFADDNVLGRGYYYPRETISYSDFQTYSGVYSFGGYVSDGTDIFEIPYLAIYYSTSGSYQWGSVSLNFDGQPLSSGEILYYSINTNTGVDFSELSLFVEDPTSVDSNLYSFISRNFIYEPLYEGNPFLDIMNMVIDALDVPIFGAFSLWDMLTTVCGLFAVVWLLKLLAGG